MRFDRCSIPGCLVVTPVVRRDARGSFVKTFHRATFAEAGVDPVHAEEYFTWSHRGVLRGLHFQVPPADGAKIVCCVAGEVLDAILDVRVGSPTYGKHETFVLSGAELKTLYLPPGIAHGFLARSDEALMHYTVSAAYAPACDTGILWSSAGIAWPVAEPLVSERDRAFPPLAAFSSPFRYAEAGHD
ncbi:MAG TPA: dTDP-4-dehydrorhamnose 3,5-epimerase family protein [Anaeromyxobacteraceae bacterium]|nr:dTDP-4-dehydrorhamnose 3,5-epimerase family protein [Anaeromyxobacteraceae bacterium]